MTEYTKRKSIRLHGFDYSQAGAYFVTICSYEKKCIFGNIVDNQTTLSKTGVFVESFWKQLPNIFSFVSLDNWVIMPNHLHGIVWLGETNHEKQNLSDVVCWFKSRSTLRCIKNFKTKPKLWQRGFYEHIVRDEKDLLRIRQYINDNPVQWAVDSENPEAIF